ncbi:MAG: bifunctional riboflavin kinase/FAD synthetase [Candidatus Omnitrophica bacterium]|jgi:riboflavin kinase/FMN adenylyltransferase|nr:bifunctional riboflavin kinase/FAD synthetase [Candidatus Omnitrophota bacterium]
MRVIYNLKDIRGTKSCVLSLGVFDGMHLAHQKILEEACAKAASIGSKSVVVTFHPHPKAKQSLYSLDHRLHLLACLGVDVCVVIRFTASFSLISAYSFIKNIIFKRIKPSFIYVGNNFRFGHNAKGDAQFLKKFSGEYGFKLRVFDTIKVNGEPVSSTYIRQLIKTGKLNRARHFLLRPVSILGTVIKGNALARRLGVPTANLNPHHEVLPASGIYAVKVFLEGKIYNGISYIGTRPTLHKKFCKPKVHIEVHIFDFSRSIYGKNMEVFFLNKIRNDKKFSSLQSLKRQIEKDILACHKFFA